MKYVGTWQSWLGAAAGALLAATTWAAAQAQPLTAKYERKWIIPDIEGEEFTRLEVHRGATRQAMGDVYIKMIRLPGMNPVDDAIRRNTEQRWPLVMALVKVRAREDVVTEDGKRKVRVIADASVETEGLPDRAQRVLSDTAWRDAVNKLEDRWGSLWGRRAALREKGEKGAGAEELKRGYAELLPQLTATELFERGLVLVQGRSEPNDAGQAKGYFQRALKFDPQFGLALGYRAYASLMTGDWANAVADYDDVLRIEPANGNAVNSRGWAHLQMKNYARAKADFEQATKLMPTFGRAWVNLGTAEHYLNRRSSAYAAWRKGCEAGVKETCDWLKKNPE